MATIVDRRKNAKGKSNANRKKFIDRYKRQIKRNVEDLAGSRDLKDIFNDGEVTISGDDIGEPSFEYDYETGTNERVHPGNDQYRRGDTIRRPKSNGSGRGGSNKGGGEDDFTFVLTKEEFLDIYFSDMELPDFLKKSMKNTVQYKYERAGYSKEGIPARLSIKKTFEQAIGRRIATRAGGKKPRYLDDVDIRYDYFTKKPKPIRTAVMFCVMDCSGSMMDFHKTIAKKFFLLLFLFLHTEYKSVELVFIRHTEVAEEVNEEDFFYSRRTGGTIVSTALDLVNNIINTRYKGNEVNFYVAQASDGDNWDADMPMVGKLIHEILPKVQYFAYIDIVHDDSERAQQMLTMYRDLESKFPHLQSRRVTSEAGVYPVLQELFKK